MNPLFKRPARGMLVLVCAMPLLSVALFGQVSSNATPAKTPTHEHVSYDPGDRQGLNLAFEYVGPAVQQKGTHVWGTSPVVGSDGRIHLFVAQWPIPDGQGATKKRKRGGFKGYYTTSEVAHYVGKSPEGPFEFVRMVAEDQDGGFNAPHNPTIKHIDGKYALCFIVNENDDRGTQRIVMYIADDVNGEFRPAKGGEVDGTVLRAPSDPGIWNHGSVRGVANPSLIKHDGEYRIYFKSAMPAPEKGVEGFYNREFGYGVATSKNLEGPYKIHPDRLTSKEVELEDVYAFTHSDKVYMISRDIEGSKGSKEGGLLWVSEDGYEFPVDKVQRSFEGLAAYKGGGEWQDYTLYRGSKEGQLERPQLLQYDGAIYLYIATGASTGPGLGSGSHILKMKFK